MAVLINCILAAIVNSPQNKTIDPNNLGDMIFPSSHQLDDSNDNRNLLAFYRKLDKDPHQRGITDIKMRQMRKGIC